MVPSFDADAWEQRNVGDFLSVSKNPGHSGVDAKKLTVKLWGRGVVEKTDVYGGSENTRYYVRRSGQFMYGKLDFLHAAFGIVPEELDRYESTLDSPAFDLFGIDGQFLLNRVTQKSFYLKHGLTANGSRKAKRVHENTFMAMPIETPTFNEQCQIGGLFTVLDNLITLHQRKYDKLIVLKKALLEKMFPREGESEPELRFAGFTDAWEQRKLGELGEFNPKSMLPESFEYVDLESVVGAEMLGHRRENRVTAPSRAQRLAQTGDIFYQTVRPYQKNNYLYELPDKDYVFSTGYAQIRPSIDSSLLFCLLQQDSFVADVLDRCTGTSYPAINANDLADIEVSAPVDADEQRPIGATFQQLDNLITLHQRK